GEIDGEEELGESDRSLSSRWERILPGRSVEIGETWSLSEEAARRLLEGMNVAKPTVWCTLSDVDARAAGKPARITLDIRASTTGAAGTSVELKASGHVLWNTEAGHLIEGALSGELCATDPDGSTRTAKFGAAHEVRKIE